MLEALPGREVRDGVTSGVVDAGQAAHRVEGVAPGGPDLVGHGCHIPKIVDHPAGNRLVGKHRPLRLASVEVLKLSCATGRVVQRGQGAVGVVGKRVRQTTKRIARGLECRSALVGVRLNFTACAGFGNPRRLAQHPKAEVVVVLREIGARIAQPAVGGGLDGSGQAIKSCGSAIGLPDEINALLRSDAAVLGAIAAGKVVAGKVHTVAETVSVGLTVGAAVVKGGGLECSGTIPAFFDFQQLAFVDLPEDAKGVARDRAARFGNRDQFAVQAQCARSPFAIGGN